MDTFIESTSKLLEAYPGATVSISYGNMGKKSPKTAKVSASSAAQNVVKFKVYDAQSSKCLRYSTYKAKEMARILMFLGPREYPRPAAEDTKSKVGVCTVMSNHEFVMQEPVERKVEEKKDGGKKRKGKKKGRK